MIVFDLACAGAGHVFEAWFGSTRDYETQRARGLVSCPVCGSEDVEKAVMAPRLSTKSNNRPARRAGKPDTDRPSPEMVKALLSTLAEAQGRVLEKSDYVGNRFVDEARAIHLGDSEQRAIHGIASPVEARGLIDEGIGIAPLLFPVRPPGADN